MRIKALSTFLSLLCLIQVEAQSWCNPGATWHYKVISVGPYQTIEIRYAGQAMVEGKQCDRLIGAIATYCLQSTPHYYDTNYCEIFVYEENDVVYYKYPGQQFDTLAVMNAVPGDSWSDVTSYGVDKRTVVDTGSVVINGNSLRALFFNTSHTLWFAEGIGYNYSYFHPSVVYDDPDIVDEEIYRNFYCYRDNSLGNYPASRPCSPLDVGIGERSKTGREFYPNPVRDFLRLETGSAGEIIIYDTSGRELRRMRINEATNHVDCRDLGPGVYCAVIVSAGGKSVGRFIKE